jgi:hypothetical protein
MKRNIPADLDSFTRSVLYPFVAVSDDGRVINFQTKSLLNPSFDGRYLRLNVRHGAGNKCVLLHRLIAEKFLGLPEDTALDQVNHKDGDKLNNNPENLEWTTLIYNVVHANETGLRDSCKGVNHHSCSVTEEMIHKVCKYMELHLSNKEIDALTELPCGTANDIRRGKRWKNIAKLYSIPIKKNKPRSKNKPD